MKVYDYNLYKEYLKFTEVTKWTHYPTGLWTERKTSVSLKNLIGENSNIVGFWLTDGAKYILDFLNLQELYNIIKDYLSFCVEKVIDLHIIVCNKTKETAFFLVKIGKSQMEELVVNDFKIDNESFINEENNFVHSDIELRAIWSNYFDSFVVMLPWEK